jgi:Flp pilus assembly protein TadG
MHASSPSPTLVPASAELQRFWRCDKGVNAIEFALVAPVIIAIVLAILQVGVIFFAQAYLETVAEEGARLVMTNQAANAGWTQAQFEQQICANVQALFDCNNLIVSLQQAPTSPAAIAAAEPQFDNNGGLKGQMPYQVLPAPSTMMLVVMYQWPVIGGPLGLNFGSLGNGNYLLVSTQVFQVEVNNTGATN